MRHGKNVVIVIYVRRLPAHQPAIVIRVRGMEKLLEAVELLVIHLREMGISETTYQQIHFAGAAVPASPAQLLTSDVRACFAHAFLPRSKVGYRPNAWCCHSHIEYFLETRCPQSTFG